MAGLHSLITTLKNKMSGTINRSNRLKNKIQKENAGAFFDAVNQDKVNVVVTKQKTKGLKKFLADVWIVITLHMKGLYWVSRMNSFFIKKPPNPTEYGTMPTVMRRQKRITNKQIMRMHDHSMRKVSGEYYMPANKVTELKRSLEAKKAAYRQNKLAEKRQSYLYAKNIALGMEAEAAAYAYTQEQTRRRSSFLELKQAQMLRDTGRERD